MVTVIVPVYNSEKYLSRCVTSILNQTNLGIELILIDDGSTDASPLICDSFTDARIVVIHKSNGGISSARNAGLEMARGEWITFCDNDDVVSTLWIERMMRIVEDGTDILPMCAYSRDPKDLGQCKSLEGINPRIRYNTSDYLHFYEKGLAGFVWNALYRRDIIERHHIRFPERRDIGDINEDLVFQMNYLPYVQGLAYTGHYDYLWSMNETNHSNETTDKWYFEKYFEKYRLLKDYIVGHVSDVNVQMRKMATMMLFHFVWAICHASSYEKMKEYVENETVQECVRWADCSKENSIIIDYILKKQVKSLYLKLLLSKLIKN